MKTMVLVACITLFLLPSSLRAQGGSITLDFDFTPHVNGVANADHFYAGDTLKSTLEGVVESAQEEAWYVHARIRITGGPQHVVVGSGAWCFLVQPEGTVEADHFVQIDTANYPQYDFFTATFEVFMSTSHLPDDPEATKIEIDSGNHAYTKLTGGGGGA